MNRRLPEALSLASACEQVRPQSGRNALLSQLQQALVGTFPDANPQLVLTRSGWHRLGGVVDSDYQRIAENIRRWAEQESDGDIDELMDRYLEHGYFATRWQGSTHFVTVPLGDGAEDFLQIEVEELQEVIDRILMDRDWFPENMEEFLEPLDLPRLEPEPVGEPRYLFRRSTSVRQALDALDPARSATVNLRRFFTDWQHSSAGAQQQAFCRCWILSLQETPLADGGTLFTARPAPTTALKAGHCGDPEGLRGAVLANWLHRLDQAAGYPFAWYFLMLATRIVPVSVGEQVCQDLDEGFHYLPERDAELIRRWSAQPYRL